MAYHRKRKPVIPLTAFLLLLILLPIALFVSKNARPTEAAWFDDTFAYRQTVPITNAGTAQTDFQVSITLNTSALVSAGKMQADCDDIRITNINGKLLPYWIETGTNACNTTTTAIWTKVPSISTSGATVYLYYGNPSATSVQNGNNVFNFFDDFNGNSIDTAKWTQGTIAATSGTSFSQSGGNLVGGNTNRYIQSLNTFSGDYIAESRTCETSPAANGWSSVGFYGSSTNSYGVLVHNGGAYFRNDGTWYNGNAFTVNQCARSKVKVVGTAATGSIVGETSGSLSDSGTNSGISSEYLYLSPRFDAIANDQNYSATWDWVIVRKAVTTEPSVASPTNEEKSPAPIAYWKFDEGYGTNTNDSTGNNPAGIITGATWAPEDQCVSGKCLYFNGSNYITISNAKTFASTEYSVSAWVKINSSSSYQDLISFNSGSLPILSLRYSTYPLLYLNSGANDYYRYGNLDITDNRWHNIQFVFKDSGNSVKIYIDGIDRTGSGPDGNEASVTSTWRIGNGAVGYIDELKVYPYQRTAAQIKADAAKGSSSSKGTSAQMGASTKNLDALSNGLVGYWKMDEASWTVDCSTESVMDSSGNSNNGASCPNSTGPTGGNTGKYGNGGTLDGTNDYIDIDDNSNLDFGTGDFSISFWGKSNITAGVADYAVGKLLNGTTYDGYHIGVNSSGYGTFIWRTDSTNYAASGSTDLTDNTWHHYLGVRNSGGLYMYVDGVLVGTNTNTAIQTNEDNDQPLAIGGARTGDTGELWAGTLDDVRIYNRALSGKEVRDLYAWAPGPVGYWNFDEKSGTSANDISGNNNTGSLGVGNSAPTWTTGKFGSGLQFTRANKYTTATITPNITSKILTISGWFKFDNLTGVQRLLYGNNSGFQMGLSGSTFFIHNINSAGTDWNTGNTTLPSNCQTGWHYFTVIRDSTLASSNVKAYCDGVQFTTGNYINALNGTFTISTFIVGYTGDNQSFDGSADDIKIYSYARTPGQIVSDMNAGHPLGGSPIASQLAYYKFDEGYGSTANNSGFGGSALNGTLGVGTSAPTWSTAGKFAKALSFDGSTDYLQTSGLTGSSLGSEYTITGWATVNTSGVVVLLSFGNDILVQAGLSDMRWQVNDSGALSVKCLLTRSTGTWYHYAVVSTGIAAGETEFYLNGIPCGDGGDIAILDSSVLDIGRQFSTNTRFWNGLIDEVKIYNTALTADEVLLDYNRGSAMVLGDSVENRDRVTSGQTLYLDATNKNSYPGSGTNWYDLSGNNYNATLSSPTWNGLKFTNTAATLTGLGTSIYPSVATNTTILWVYPETGSGSVWLVTPQDVHTYMSYSGDSSAYINTWDNGSGQRTIWNVTESVPHQIVITKNGSVRTTYDNLVQKGQVTLTDPAPSVNSNTVFGVAAQPMGLSIVETYNRVLSADEITQDYYAHAYKFNVNAEPVAEWKMDEGTGTSANDTSGNGNTGNLGVGTSAPSWSTGKIGKALKFDGSDDYVQSSIASSLTTVTISTWIKPNAFPGSLFSAPVSLSNGGQGATSYDKQIRLTPAGKATFYIWDGAQKSATSTTTLNTGTWYHITGVTDGTYVYIYVNGILENKTAAGTSYAGNTNMVLSFVKSGEELNYNGLIDQVKIYNYARTASQVAWDYNRGGPVGHWKLDECQGITANDASGNANNGTITIGATGTQSVLGTCSTGIGSTAAWGNGSVGKYSSSLNFDGTDDGILINSPNTARANGQPMTVSAWVYWKGGTGYQDIIAQREPHNWIFYLHTSNHELSFHGSAQNKSTYVMPQNQWKHVVATVTEGGVSTIYVDGVVVYTNPSFTYNTSSSSYLRIGTQGTLEYFNGQIDDVRVYNYALTPTQVKTLYNSGAAVQFAPATGSP